METPMTNVEKLSKAERESNYRKYFENCEFSVVYVQIIQKH